MNGEYVGIDNKCTGLCNVTRYELGYMAEEEEVGMLFGLGDGATLLT